MEKLLVGKIEKQQAAWEKPKNVVEPVAEAEAPRKETLGNGGEWTANMPATIQAGGSGEFSAANKQAKADAMDNADAKADKTKKEAEGAAEEVKPEAKSDEPKAVEKQEEKAEAPKTEEKAAAEKAPEAPKADAAAPADKADV